MCKVLTWKSLDRWLGKKEPQVQVNDDNAVSKGHSVVLLTFRLKSYGSNTTNQMQSEKEICPKKGISIALYSRLTPDIFFQCSNLRKWSRNMTAIDGPTGFLPLPSSTIKHKFQGRPRNTATTSQPNTTTTKPLQQAQFFRS